jgi:hypothetical protein
MNRTSPIPTAPSRRGFLAVLSAGAASAVAPAALAGASVSVAKSPAGDLPTSMAAPSPDAALLQLVDQYLAAHAEYRRLDAICDRAYTKMSNANPMPDVLRVRPEDQELGLPNPFQRRDDVNVRLGGSPIGGGGAEQSYSGVLWIDELRAPKWPVVAQINLPEGLEHGTVGGKFGLRYVDPPTPAARARADEIVQAFDEWWPRHHQSPRGIRSMERKMDAALKFADRLRRKVDRSQALTLGGLIAKAKVAACESCDDDPQFGDSTRTSIARDLLRLGRVLS